jgi:segregation and condensation protein B
MTKEHDEQTETSVSSEEASNDIEEQTQIPEQDPYSDLQGNGTDSDGDGEEQISDDESQMSDEESSDLSAPNQDAETTVQSVVEAVLFASDEPLTESRLANIVETGVKQVRQHIENLNEKYQTNHNAFRIEQIAGGYQMLTLSPYNHWLRKLLRVRSDSKLSPAAMETLAIVAYKQPVMRADIEVIRGVAAGEVLRSLCYKGLVKIVGRAEVLGRPMLYGTTKKFLEVFGMNTLKDLPKIEELKKPPA